MAFTPLTDLQRQIITESFARLIPISAEAASLFYTHLWAIAPETRELFRTDLSQQGQKLMQTLGITVRALHDPDSLAPYLRDLGQRHIGYRVTKDQYVLVKSALLYMIEQCLGEDYTPEARQAWDAAYELIAEFTISAYDT